MVNFRRGGGSGGNDLNNNPLGNDPNNNPQILHRQFMIQFKWRLCKIRWCRPWLRWWLLCNRWLNPISLHYLHHLARKTLSGGSWWLNLQSSSMLWSQWKQMIGSRPLRASWRLLIVWVMIEFYMPLINYKVRPKIGGLPTLLLIPMLKLSLGRSSVRVFILIMCLLVKSRWSARSF